MRLGGAGNELMETPSGEVRRLIDAARAGDRAAADRLLDRYRAYLVSLARMSMNRNLRQKLDASDVVQSALVKAQRGIPEFRGETEQEVVAWLRQILARSVADADRHYRKNAGRAIGREQSLDELFQRPSQADAVPVANGSTPSRGAERKETNAFVRGALAELKPDDRQVIELRSLEGLEWSEVGRRMERSSDAVRVQWGRAIRRLGVIVEERRWKSR